jgi:hypothetical protein
MRPASSTSPTVSSIAACVRTGRGADDRDVEAGKQRSILRVRRAAVADRAGMVGLLAVLPPALEGIDHRA